MSRTAELPDRSPASSTADLSLLELKEAADSPTPLSGILQDASLLRLLMSPRRSSSTRSTKSSQREKERQRKESDASSVLTLVLAEEERQAHTLKASLRALAERLAAETRRADAADVRARAAETRTREACARAERSDAARMLAEREVVQAREEMARERVRAETAERDVRRAEGDVARLGRMRADAEDAAADARENARRATATLREWQAREEGRAEGVRVEVRRRYEDGKEDGFEDGRAEGFEAGRACGLEEGKEEGYFAGRAEGLAGGRLAGFEEGREVGMREGRREGYESGRRDERARALEAFDAFVEESVVSDEPDRVLQWVEATREDANAPASPGPRREVPAPPSVSPWLHRQPRSTPAQST